MYMNAYHKEQGEVRMFEVDARNAIARFPAEWAAEPWEADDASATKRGRPKKVEEKPTEKEDNTEAKGDESAAGAVSE